MKSNASSVGAFDGSEIQRVKQGSGGGGKRIFLDESGGGFDVAKLDVRVDVGIFDG